MARMVIGGSRRRDGHAYHEQKEAQQYGQNETSH
jgi:hypothetical protein